MRSNSRAAAIISYITWLGFFIALVMRDPADRFTAHHINQALVLNLVGLAGGLLAIIPVLGTIASGVISIGIIVLDIMGISRAATGSTEPLPFIGDIHIMG